MTSEDAEGSELEAKQPETNRKRGLSSAFLAPGLLVTFKGLTYTVSHHSNRKEKVSLLQGVSGYLRPGDMSALMGPSGSGKTTLLDVLAGRKTVGAQSGDIHFDGRAPSKAFLQRFTCYVEQFDTLIANLTVYEMLMYTALLKRPVEQPLEELRFLGALQKQAAVEELIHCLALQSCRSISIGSPLARGISGGQAKRVNIGIALVSSPSLIFLDEPTSGLDSYTAEEVMSVVKGLARMGMTVVATIHSPTPFIFSLFDQLLMLLKGSMVYFGPSGQAAVDFFRCQASSLGRLQLTHGKSDAEWLVDVITQADSQGLCGELAEAYSTSSLKQLADATIEQQLQGAREAGGQVGVDQFGLKEILPPFWWGLSVLFKFRTAKNYRSAVYLAPRVGLQLVCSFLLFTLFWRLGDDLDPTNVVNIAASIFIWAGFAAYSSAVYTPPLVLERPLFVRERHDGLYSTLTYLTHKMLEEGLLNLTVSLPMSALVFYTVRLQGSWLLYWLVYFCTLEVSVALGYFVATLSPTMEIANAAVPACVLYAYCFCGFLMRLDSFPPYWAWATYLNFMRFAFGSLMINQYEGVRNIAYQGTTVLEFFSLDGSNKWAWLGLESCFVVFFFLCAFLALSHVSHVRR